MPKILVLLVTYLFCINANSQKIDFDRFIVETEFAKLPKQYTDPANRTYTLKSNLETALQMNTRELIHIYGFKETEKNGQLDIEIKAGSMTRGTAQTGSRLVENKDKNGKVTSKYTVYYVSTINPVGSGWLTVYGPKTEDPKKAAKKERKRKKDDDEQKPEKVEEVNPFLNNIEIEKPLVETESKKRTLIASYNNGNYSYTTSEYSNSRDALNNFELNREVNFQNHLTSYKNSIVFNTNRKINDLYGYAPEIKRLKFHILDTEKHPEYKNYQNACNAIKLILKKLVYNKPTDEVKQDLNSVISYFESLKSKYGSSEKSDKKLRHFTALNLATIFYALDLTDKCIEEANYIIALDYDKEDGEDFFEDATELQEDLNRLKMSSRRLIEKE
ncbi:MAG: hypothetical protein IPG55_06580 [Saprospiraceae bacterium]|nr:hypothetical protein [Candidatus Defluviibacterium haderslevense]